MRGGEGESKIVPKIRYGHIWKAPQCRSDSQFSHLCFLIPDACTPWYGRVISGDPLQVVSDIPSWEHCGQLCQEHSQCEGWSWVIPHCYSCNNKGCYLYSNPVSLSDTKPLFPVISGPKTCYSSAGSVEQGCPEGNEINIQSAVCNVFLIQFIPKSRSIQTWTSGVIGRTASGNFFKSVNLCKKR